LLARATVAEPIVTLVASTRHEAAPRYLRQVLVRRGLRLAYPQPEPVLRDAPGLVELDQLFRFLLE